MTDKLESKLIQYEKDKPINGKADLKEAVESIIEAEFSQSDELVDFDFVDEATEFLISLDGINSDDLSSDVQRIEESIIKKHKTIESESSDDGLSKEKTSKKTGIRKKWIIILAAAISVIAAILVTSYGLGFDFVSMTKEFFMSLKPKTEYSDGQHDVIVTDSVRKYSTLKEMIDAEHISGLLENDCFNDPDVVDTVRFQDLGTEIKVLIILKGEYSGEFEITIPFENTVAFDPIEKVGILDVHFTSYDDVFQAEWYYKGNYYCLTEKNQQSLLTILEKFKESE
jgi:hypothetical protein